LRGSGSKEASRLLPSHRQVVSNTNVPYDHVDPEQCLVFSRFIATDVQTSILLTLGFVLGKVGLNRVFLCPRCKRFEVGLRAKRSAVCAKCGGTVRVQKSRNKGDNAAVENIQAGWRKDGEKRSQAAIRKEHGFTVKTP